MSRRDRGRRTQASEPEAAVDSAEQAPPEPVEQPVPEASEPEAPVAAAEPVPEPTIEQPAADAAPTVVPAAVVNAAQAEMAASVQPAAPAQPASGVVRVRALKSCIIGAGARFAGDVFRMRAEDAEARVARGEVEILP